MMDDGEIIHLFDSSSVRTEPIDQNESFVRVVFRLHGNPFFELRCSIWYSQYFSLVSIDITNRIWFVLSADACFQPKEVGDCKAIQPRFYYNASTRKCQRFIYGGCDGNDNNYPTEEACAFACEAIAPVTPPHPVEEAPPADDGQEA